jgi:hypothetical protein
MKFLKLQILIIALFIVAASSAFADSFYYEVTIDTSAIADPQGYLYFQYVPVSGADSTATVADFKLTGGVLGDQSAEVVDGSAVSGVLPDPVVFANTNAVNDYNQAIFFRIFFNGPAPGGDFGGSSTFSLGLFQDEYGASPLLTSDGTLFTTTLLNDGNTLSEVFANEATVTYVPEAGSLWLLGSGLLGLLGICRRIKK